MSATYGDISQKEMCNTMTFSKETKQTGSEFQNFGLAAPLLKNISELGFTQATPVQTQVIPAALAGGDLLVSSQTGSGKTAAFLLPIIHQLIEDNPKILQYRVVHNQKFLCSALPASWHNKLPLMRLILYAE
jgi:superfamily II DNA/RNA helicase